MPQAYVVMTVRHLNPTTSIIDIQGEVSGFAEKVLMDAYTDNFLTFLPSTMYANNG